MTASRLSRTLLTLPGSLHGRLRRVADLFWAALSEIFDESAYRRFLQRHQLQRSRRSYAAFRQENDAVKARRPRCC